MAVENRILESMNGLLMSPAAVPSDHIEKVVDVVRRAKKPGRSQEFDRRLLFHQSLLRSPTIGYVSHRQDGLVDIQLSPASYLFHADLAGPKCTGREWMTDNNTCTLCFQTLARAHGRQNTLHITGNRGCTHAMGYVILDGLGRLGMDMSPH